MATLEARIGTVTVEKAMKDAYLPYSLLTIRGRALPDARDGLKPVHRRVLYAMYGLKIWSNTPFKKSARVVGDTIGKYHPHGDTSVYDALTILAQDFSTRVPLIDGQGNFGSIDGDKPAAMRYTEVRLTKTAEQMLDELSMDTVDMVPNYDGSTNEPSVLPIKMPVLLMNGTSGIATGVTTKIPPHNPNELINGVIALLDDPDITCDELLEHIPGPDYPTGGIVYKSRGLMDSYTGGVGSHTIRALIHKESNGVADVIVITELPYKVNKATLIKHIATLHKDKEIEGIAEVRDESDKDGIRVVIELKRNALYELVLKTLYVKTELEITFATKMNAIVDGELASLNLKSALSVFIDHRKTVVVRRTINELDKLTDRLHVLEGLKIANDNIDEVIKIIKESKDDKDAKGKLEDTFKLTPTQSSTILNMRFRQLSNMEVNKIINEIERTTFRIEELRNILADESMVIKIVKDEMLDQKMRFASPRRTSLEVDYEGVNDEDLIPNESMVVTITTNGYVKRVKADTYSEQRRGGTGKTGTTVHEDDSVKGLYTVNSHDTLLILTNKGRLYWLKVYKVPEAGRTAKGTPIVNLINLESDESVVEIIPTHDFDESKQLMFFTKFGIVKSTELSSYSNIRQAGVIAIGLNPNDIVVSCAIVDSSFTTAMIVTSVGKSIKFNISEVRITGRTTVGVKGINLPDGVTVKAGLVFKDESEEVLIITDKGNGKRSKVTAYTLQARGGKGVIAMKLTPKTGSVLCALRVYKGVSVMAVSRAGKIIKFDPMKITSTGRATSGVSVVNLGKNDSVVNATVSIPDDDNEEQ